MKNINSYYSKIALLSIILLLVLVGCERDINELEPATYPKTAEVFIDGFSAGLQYSAFGGSNVSAFDVDTDVKYKGSSSMRFSVPDFEDPQGGYAGGVYHTAVARDLSDYNVLTFWAKASKAANIDLIGLGNDLGEAKYQVSISNVPVNSNWKKYYIPLPDASKMKQEKGMFFYSEGPEDGKGYTFWIDEVKFEKLGTIAHHNPIIQDGKNKIVKSFNGVTEIITNLGLTVNLPTGINQFVNVTPAYFEFASSNPAAATVNEIGVVKIVGEGEATITGKIGNFDATGSLSVKSMGEFAQPPIPEIDAADVISIYSNAYTNVPVDYYNGYWAPYQTTLSSFLKINENDLINYTNFNFVGIQFTSPIINVSAMTHLHMDLFTLDPVDASTVFKISLLDAGSDGVIGNDDTSSQLTFKSLELQSGKWVSLDIPLADFVDLASKVHLAQMIFEGTLSGFITDNIYFYNAGDVGGEPTEAAPIPTQTAENVISIFSDAYANVENTDFNPNWGQSTVASQMLIADNNTLLFSGLNYQGIQFGSAQDVSEMESLHIDYWTDNSSALNIYLISSGKEKAYALPVPTDGWTSIDVPLSEFADVVDLKDVIQFKFDGNGKIFIDNLYFHKTKGTATEPTEAAPTPTHDAANVISIFSDAYTNLDGTDFNPNWGQSTQVSNVDIAGNITMKYATFNYQGTQFAANQDLSGLEYLHVDMWTVDATSVQMSPISASSGEKLYELTPINARQWNSYDIPLSVFTDAGVSMSDILQLKFDGQAGTNPSNIWLDNIYFYKAASAATEPIEAAPIPTHNAVNVISIFSDAYSNLDGTDFNPNWGQSTQVSNVDIAGNTTMKYATFNYQGTQFAANQDLSGMKYLHVDMWTADATSVQMSPISASSGEKLYELTLINAGQWNSYDIPLSVFTDAGVSMSDILQLKFDGQAGINPSNIWLDNIYFYKSDGGSGSTAQYCEKEVTHLGIAAETASKIKLTITNVGEKSMKITIESADSDAVDDLIVNNLTGPITGSPAVSATDNSVAGKLSKTLTWDETPPSEVELCVLWSKASFGGNWQLKDKNVTIGFNETCN